MFENKSDSQLIDDAVNEANQLINSISFTLKIAEKQTFDMAVVNGDFIAKAFEDFYDGNYGTLKVYTYKPSYRWSKAYGYFSPSKPDCIFLNQYKLIRFSDENKNLASLVASLIHESVHYLSYKTNKYFNHGSNSPVGKENTAPYWIDSIAENIILGKEVSQDLNNGGNIIIYKPWYKRLFDYLREVFNAR